VIGRLERLLNLVIALRETRVPLTAGDVRNRVAGYDQPDAEAFRRTFERDKADLRALGVPVSTAPVDRWDDRVGYRIDPAAYDLPPVRLEPDELAALALALQATGLVDEAGAGLRKLAVDAELALPEDPAAPLLAGPGAAPAAIEVELDAPHRAALMQAQLTRTRVRFTYRPTGRPAAARLVDPHALVLRGGRWYLVGHDHDRGERRAFRLDRIAGEVATVGEPWAFAPPAVPVDVDDVVPAAPAEGPRRATVLADPAVAWRVAGRAAGGGEPAPGDRTRFSVPVGDPDAFVTWALEFGPDLEVTDPPELRARLVERARAALAAARAAMAP